MTDNLSPLPLDARRARREIVCRSRRPGDPLRLRLRDLDIYPHARAFTDVPGFDEEDPPT